MVELDIEKKDEFQDKYKERIKIIEERQTDISVKPVEPYKYFFDQEIHEQPFVLKSLILDKLQLSETKENKEFPEIVGVSHKIILPQFEPYRTNLAHIKKCIIVACGSSLYASQYASSIIKQLRIFDTITCIEGSQFIENDLPLASKGHN